MSGLEHSAGLSEMNVVSRYLLQHAGLHLWMEKSQPQQLSAPRSVRLMDGGSFAHLHPSEYWVFI